MGLQKNTASQQWIVFAFDRTDNVPKTGDAANITANLRIDGGGANAVDDTNPTELEDGFYIFDITAAESNGDLIVIAPASSTSDIQVIGVPGAQYTCAPNSNLLGIESDGDLTKVNTLNGHTAQTADHTSAIADIPTVAEFNARTIVSANYFDPAVDAVATVTLVVTTTTNSDMRGTDSGATAADLLDKLGAVNESAAAGDPSATESVMQYVKQLVNVLVGTTGVTTFPTEAAPANNVSLAEVIRAMHADVTGLAGSVMRGTDSALLASSDGSGLTEAGGTGDHLTAIDLPNQTMNITGNLSGSVGSVTGAVGSVTGAVGSVTGGLNTAGTISTLDALDTAQDTQHTTTQTDISNLNDPTVAAIADGVWDEVQSGHVTAGTFGLYLDTEVSGVGGGTPPTAAAIADAVLDELTAGHTTAGSLSKAIIDILADTNELQSDDVPTLIAALPTATEIDTELTSNHGSGAWTTATSVTVSDKTGFKLASDGLALVTSWTVGITGNITGNLSGSVGSVTGAVGSVTGAVGSIAGNVGGNVVGSVGSVLGGLNTSAGTLTTLDALDTAQDTEHDSTQSDIAALNDLSSANILTQVNAALDTAIAELGVAAPTATPTLRTGLILLYMALRNKLDVTNSAKEIHNDAGTVVATKTISDDGTTYSETEMA